MLLLVSPACITMRVLRHAEDQDKTGWIAEKWRACARHKHNLRHATWRPEHKLMTSSPENITMPVLCLDEDTDMTSCIATCMSWNWTRIDLRIRDHLHEDNG